MTIHRLLLAVWAICAVAAPASAELVIYGSRDPRLMEPLFDAYSRSNGVPVRYVWEKSAPLLDRLREEGENSPADLLLVSDIGLLETAREDGLLQPLRSPLLSTLIPAAYREPDGHWFGLSLRARMILYAPDRVGRGELRGYEDLASPELRGRLCIRSSEHEYNRFLVAGFLTRWGPARTREWVQGLAANLARPPTGGDRDQIRALAAGICDVAVVNSYYYAMMLDGSDDQDRKAASSLDWLWPSGGVHVNISGGGVMLHAPHPELAAGFLEFLTGTDSQRMFAELNQEYPVVAGVPVTLTLVTLGSFVADFRPLTMIARQRGAAKEILQQSAWK